MSNPLKIRDIKKDKEVKEILKDAARIYELYDLKYRKESPLKAEDDHWLEKVLKKLREKKQSIQLFYAYMAKKQNSNKIKKLAYRLSIQFTTDFTEANFMPLVFFNTIANIPAFSLLLGGIIVLAAGIIATGIGFLIGAVLCVIPVVAYHIYFRQNRRNERRLIELQGYAKKLFG